MGTLIRVWKKSPLPHGAKIGRTGTVTWTVKGKKRTGKLSGTDTVSHQVDTWSAEFTDEAGKVRRVSTKTKNRSAAEQILARYEAEVARIKSGVVTREELTKAKTPQITLGVRHTVLNRMSGYFTTTYTPSDVHFIGT